jgi:hypothetical protein
MMFNAVDVSGILEDNEDDGDELSPCSISPVCDE